MTVLLSHSGATTLTRCPQRFYLVYRKHLRSEGFAEAPSIGTAVHAGGEELRSSGHMDYAAHAAKREIVRLSAGAEEATQARALAMTTALFAGYAAHLWLPRPIRSVHSELDLRVPLIDGVDLKGRLDGVILRPGKAPCLYEFKTTSETLQAKLCELRTGWQLPLYTYLYEEMFGERMAGAIVEIVKKPVRGGRGSVKKLDGETWEQWCGRVAAEYMADPTRYFQREYIRREEMDVEGCVAEMTKCARLMLQCDETGYPRIPGQCSGKYGDCPYKRYCWHGDEEGYVARPYEFDGEKTGEKAA